MSNTSHFMEQRVELHQAHIKELEGYIKNMPMSTSYLVVVMALTHRIRYLRERIEKLQTY